MAGDDESNEVMMNSTENIAIWIAFGILLLATAFLYLKTIKAIKENNTNPISNRKISIAFVISMAIAILALVATAPWASAVLTTGVGILLASTVKIVLLNMK
jgi:hypothetical protein